MALLIGGGFGRLMDALFGLAEAGYDPGPAAQAAFALIGRLGLAIIVAPVRVRRRCFARSFAMRSLVVQSGLTGALAALLPLAMLQFARAPSQSEARILGALVLVGAMTGFVYWLVAGRSAGGEPRQPATG